MRKGPTYFYVQRHRSPRETAGRMPAEVRLHLGHQLFAQKRCGVLVDLPYERVLLGVAPLLPGIVDPVSQKPPVEDGVDVFREALDETEALRRALTSGSRKHLLDGAPEPLMRIRRHADDAVRPALPASIRANRPQTTARAIFPIVFSNLLRFGEKRDESIVCYEVM